VIEVCWLCSDSAAAAAKVNRSFMYRIPARKPVSDGDEIILER